MMFPFGHAGFAVGAVILLIFFSKKPGLFKEVDLRIVVVASMLPDIIDKPLGHFILGEDLNNGRIFAHTMVFVILCGAVALGIFKKTGIFYVIPVALHQLLDWMWEIPRTWFWPAFGIWFKTSDIEVWGHWFEQLTGNPYVLSGEASGLAILVAVFIVFGAYKKDNFLRGLKRGRLL